MSEFTGDVHRRVHQGERLRIQADTWNAVLDTVKKVDQLDTIAQDAEPVKPYRNIRQLGRVKVQNKTGGVVPVRGVLAIGDPVITPTASEDEFYRIMNFEGAAPAAASDRVVILEQPLANDEWGWGIISGVTPVEIDILDAGHTLAQPKAAGVDYLESNASGTIPILYKEAGTGVKRCYVLLGDRVGASGGGTITVRESDGTPTVANVDTIHVDQDQGGVVTDLGGGGAEISWQDASRTAVGVVNITTQEFNGGKTFWDPVRVYPGYNLIPGNIHWWDIGVYDPAGVSDGWTTIISAIEGNAYSEGVKGYLTLSQRVSSGDSGIGFYVEEAFSDWLHAYANSGLLGNPFGNAPLFILDSENRNARFAIISPLGIRVGGTANSNGQTFVGGLYISGGSTGTNGQFP